MAVRRDERIYVQVCRNLPEESDREVANLLEIKDHYPKYVVTLDELAAGNINGVKNRAFGGFFVERGVLGLFEKSQTPFFAQCGRIFNVEARKIYRKGVCVSSRPNAKPAGEAAPGRFFTVFFPAFCDPPNRFQRRLGSTRSLGNRLPLRSSSGN